MISIIIFCIAGLAGVGLAIYYRVQLGRTYDWYEKLATANKTLEATVKYLTELYTIELDKLYEELFAKGVFATQEEFDTFVDGVVEKAVTEFNKEHNVNLFQQQMAQQMMDQDEEE